MLKATTCQARRFPSDCLRCISLSLRPGSIETVHIPGSNLASWISVHTGMSWRYGGLNPAIWLKDTASSFLSPQWRDGQPKSLLLTSAPLDCWWSLIWNFLGSWDWISSVSYYAVLIESGTSTSRSIRVEWAKLHWYCVHSRQLKYNLLRQHADYIFPCFFPISEELTHVETRVLSTLYLGQNNPKQHKRTASTQNGSSEDRSAWW